MTMNSKKEDPCCNSTASSTLNSCSGSSSSSSDNERTRFTAQLMSEVHSSSSSSSSSRKSDGYEYVYGKDQDQELLEPWSYIRQIPGKNIRGKLIQSFQRWIPTPKEKIEAIQDIVAFLHDASLLVDDIEDDSELRRGVPVAHSIYGIPSTINCANFVYFLALEKCHKLDNRRAMDVYVQEMIRLHRGQGHDIRWRDLAKCPTEEEYSLMVVDKTGGLFRLSVGLMQAFTTVDTDFVPLLNMMALYFQIRDDYINLTSKNYMENKSFCEDLTEGKFSFPLIHAIRNNPRDNRLLSILGQRTKNIEVKKHAVQYMEQVGSFEYTKKKLDEIMSSLKKMIADHDGNDDLSTLLNKLHESIHDAA